MAYTELIKNFDRIRSYMREFYVYGFKSREEFHEKSARSYDNERRRVESYLGEHMGFRQTPSGKNVFLSIDSRNTGHNPLYKAWKSKSFTNGDITMHFILMDILQEPPYAFTLKEILNQMDEEYLTDSRCALLFEESTVRKKLQEYTSLGLIDATKQGKTMYYSLKPLPCIDSYGNALSYFSEVTPCGVLGSYLLDRIPQTHGMFSFKHHYIAHTMESEIVCTLLDGIRTGKYATIVSVQPRKQPSTTQVVLPLKIFISVQNGRQYLLAMNQSSGHIRAMRIDYITKVSLGEVCPSVFTHRERLAQMQKHMWGVSTNSAAHLESVEFTIHFDNDEPHIYQRLLRERRCGEVELLDANTCRFRAEVYDSMELLPWIRTFLCRITSIHFSNKALEHTFYEDLKQMCHQYGIIGDQ